MKMFVNIFNFIFSYRFFAYVVIFSYIFDQYAGNDNNQHTLLMISMLLFILHYVSGDEAILTIKKAEKK